MTEIAVEYSLDALTKQKVDIYHCVHLNLFCVDDNETANTSLQDQRQHRPWSLNSGEPEQLPEQQQIDRDTVQLKLFKQ